MPIPGEYEYKDQHGAGRVVLRGKETPQAFSLTLIENTIRYEAPQIDDLFSRGETVTIRKAGSIHAVSTIPAYPDWFTLYPYRVGVPYAFDLIH